MTPAFRLVVDGQDVSSRFAARLISLSLSETRGEEADQLDVQLSDHDGALAIPPLGASVTLALGWAGQGLVDKGRFTVDERSHGGTPDVLTLRARAADFKSAFRKRRERSWTGKTLGDVLKEVAGGAGLQAAVDPALAAEPAPVLEQSRESDSALLKRLGKQYDAVATVKGGKLLFAPIGKGKSASGLALPAVTLVRASGDRHTWTNARREEHSGAEASWHDADAAEKKTVTVGEDGDRKRLKKTYATEAAAKAAAQAEQRRQKRGESSFSLQLAYGRADLAPEQRLRVQGFKPEIDGLGWLIKSVRHDLSSQGFTTGIEAELAI